MLLAESLPIFYSDSSIVNGARISFAKRAEMFTDEKNVSLLKHLHKNGHWSPYGHARELFEVVLTNTEALFFFENAKLAGFSWVRSFPQNEFSSWLINGSLWAWQENIKWLPLTAAKDIATELWRIYPKAAPVLFDKRLVYQDDPNQDRIKLAFPRLPEDNVLHSKIIYVSLRIRAPIWVARQLVKHQVHLCWNEESRRYITDDPTYYVPELRKAAENVKQGSREEEITHAARYKEIIKEHHAICDRLYKDLIIDGAAPEIARGVLPLNVETNWVWTGSLHAWDRVCRERIASGAQKETRLLVEQIEKQIEPLYKSWFELRQLKYPLENEPAWTL
jgi:thymidylate synthase (FAD)